MAGCKYLPVSDVIVSAYAAGANFTTPASLTEIAVTNTTIIKKQQQAMVSLHLFILILHLPLQT